MKKKREELLNDSIFKLFIKYFIPILISSIVIVFYNIVDRYFVGKISETALAGAGVSFYIVMIIVAFSMLVGVGSGTVVSLSLGRRRYREAEKLLGNAVTIFFILGVVLFLIFKINLDNILIYSGANSETLPYARDYLNIVLYTIFPLFYSYGLTNILNAAGTPRIAMFSLIIGGVSNIILDYIAVMILNMGIKGTAYATLIGNVLASLFVMYFLIKGRLPFKINLFGYELENSSLIKLKFRNLKLNYKATKNIISVGMSPFLLNAASSGVGIITNRIVDLNGGTYGVAIVTIINSYLPIMTMTVYSVAQAMQPIIGFNYGAENYKRVKKALYISLLVGIVLSFAFWLLVIFIPREMILFFNEKSTERALTEGVRALQIYFSLTVLSSVAIIIPNYFQSIGRPKEAVILNLLRQIVLFLLGVIIFTRIWKLDGVWYTQPFTDGVFFVILSIFLYIETKKLNKKIKESENV